MTTTYDSHLNLITDLLSPIEFPRSSLTSLAHHVAVLDNVALAHLVQTMATSAALWPVCPSRPSAAMDSADSDTVADSYSSWLHLDAARARDVFYAIEHGITTRFDILKAVHGKGWKVRRRVFETMRVIYNTLSTLPVSSTHVASASLARHPFVPIVIASAVASAVQKARQQKSSIVAQNQALKAQVAKLTVEIWATVLPVLPNQPLYDVFDDNDSLFAWLVINVLSNMTAEQLSPLASEPFIDTCFDVIRGIFLHGSLTRDLALDTERTSQGLIWNHDSKSSREIRLVTANPIFQSLQRLSRTLGMVIESIPISTAASVIGIQLEELKYLVHRMYGDWLACDWSQSENTAGLQSEVQGWQQIQRIHDTLLFTCTMIYSSVVSMVNAQLPSHSTSSTNREAVHHLASMALHTFSYLYFVTTKFGTEGFEAYRSLWYGMLDLFAKGTSEQIDTAVRSLEPHFINPAGAETVETNPILRTRVTYYLNAVEQLLPVLEDGYVETTVLTIAKPYLESSEYREASEAAHSVLLAIFAKGRAVSIPLTPWYSRVLITGYPDALDIRQLRLAYTTMVTCISEADEDALVWYCLEDLWTQVTSVAASRHVRRKAAIDTVAHSPQGGHSSPSMEVSMESAVSQQDSASPTENAATTDIALQSPQGAWMLTLIDQASAVKVQLLVPLLDRIAWILMTDDLISPPQSRTALIVILFNTISGGMDMTKREVAAKWWLQHRQQFYPKPVLPAARL